MCNLLFHSSSSFSSSLSSLFKMLQFFQRHEINKMHKTPIVSLIFTFLFSLFFTWAAFASLPQANANAKRRMQMQSGFTRYI